MGCHFCPDAVNVFPMDGYILRVSFGDGSVKLYDFTPLLDKGVFRRLRDLELFRKAHALDGAVVWDESLDIAPEEIHYHGVNAS